MPLWMLVVYPLAVARLTGLIVADEITRPAREAALRRFDPTRPWHRWVAYLLGADDDNPNGCSWCVSIWVGLVAAPLAWWHGSSPWVAVPALLLAFSQAAGMIARIGRG